MHLSSKAHSETNDHCSSWLCFGDSSWLDLCCSPGRAFLQEGCRLGLGTRPNFDFNFHIFCTWLATYVASSLLHLRYIHWFHCLWMLFRTNLWSFNYFFGVPVYLLTALLVELQHQQGHIFLGLPPQWYRYLLIWSYGRLCGCSGTLKR